MTFRNSFLAIALFAGALAAEAQTSVTTDPVGFTTLSLLGNSDTFVSPPLTRPPEFVGSIQSISGNSLTVTGTPNWSVNQFVYVAGTQAKHYYVLIGPASAANPKEGHLYTVTANSTNALTVDTTSDDLSGLPSNTQVVLIPYWTLATIFPTADQNVSFTPSTSNRLTSLKTQVLIPDYTTAGINLAYTATYYFINNTVNGAVNVGWRLYGDPVTTDHSDDPILPDVYFVVRNPTGTPTLSLTAAGSVLMKKLTIPLLTSSTQERDNPASIVRPVSVALKDTGLNPSDGSFVAST